MKVEIQPTQDAEKLRDNLKKRVEEIEIKEEKLVARIKEENIDVLDRTPGIEEYKVDGETQEGIKGRPVQEAAYAKLETKEDVAKAFLATVEGYNLRILNTSEKWNLKLLRRYNPDIINVKSDEPEEVLGIEKTLDEEDDERKHLEFEVDEEEVEMLNRFIQPGSSED